MLRLPLMGDEPRISSHHITETLYATCFEQLVAFLRGRFGSGPPSPEDLAQTAFERLLTARELRDNASPKAFLWRTASNLAISSLRKSGVEQRNQPQIATLFLDEEGCRLTPDRVIAAKEQLNTVYEVLLQMSDARREAFLLVRVDGLGHGEAAQRLGVSRAAVSKHVSKATKELAAALKHA